MTSFLIHEQLHEISRVHHDLFQNFPDVDRFQNFISNCKYATKILICVSYPLLIGMNL